MRPSNEEEARRNEYFEDRNRFLEENMYDPNRDYSKDFGKLFGAVVDSSSELYYSGPQSSWQGALDDRIQERGSRKENIYGQSGYFEGSTGTMDRNLQRQMYRRNNAIEDMFRKGYSTTQIQAHVEGKRNVLEEGPDYKDYEKAKAGEKVFNVPARRLREGWAEGYFDVPKSAAGGSNAAAKSGAAAASAPAASSPQAVFIAQPNRGPDMSPELFSQGGGAQGTALNLLTGLQNLQGGGEGDGEGEGSDPYYNPDYQYVPSSVQDMIYGLFNPYASEVMLQYGYQPPIDPVTGEPAGTPSLTNPGTYADPSSTPGPSGPPLVYIPPDPVNPLDFGVDPTPDPPPDPGPTFPDPTFPDPTSPDPTSPDPTDPGTTPTGYVGAASLKGFDELAHRKRNYLGGMDVRVGSKQEVSAEDFNRLLGGIQGKYGEGAYYDAERGSVYQNYDRVNTMEYPPKNTSYVPIGIDPRNYSDTEALQAAHLGLGDQVDERGRSKRSREPIYTSQRIGDKMYFVDGGKIYSYDVRDKYTSTPSFATGGAVSKVASTGVGTLFNGYF